MSKRKRPNSMRHLDDAIRREYGKDQGAYVRIRTLMANAIVAQMLPDGVIKGGSAIKMRYGNANTRYTTDLATTRRVCERLFVYRQAQAWPPTVVAREGWAEQYLAQAEGLPVAQDVGEAIVWANSLIASIRNA